MHIIEIDKRGLTIPPEYLAGLSGRVCVRHVDGALLIEPEGRAGGHERLSAMVERLRNLGDAPSEIEIAALVDEVRTDRARHR